MNAIFDGRVMVELYRYLEEDIALKRLMLPTDPMGRLIPSEESPLVQNVMEEERFLRFVRSIINHLL
jgi:hypothetical protein